MNLQHVVPYELRLKDSLVYTIRQLSIIMIFYSEQTGRYSYVTTSPKKKLSRNINISKAEVSSL